jgi:hypothetical protein
MDFVSAWKAISIALTGAFGLLGLLTENKNKETGKLTSWGKVSLGGIVLSTALGVVAQLRETSEETQRREATASQTLKLVEQTGDAVSDIRRLLSPLDISTVSATFVGTCADQKFASFCAQAHALQKSGNWHGGYKISTMADPAVWKMWPQQEALFLIQFDIFRDPPDSQMLSRGLGANSSDLEVNVYATNYAKDKSLEVSWDDEGKIEIAFYDYEPFSIYANGRITSVADLQGATLLITGSENELAQLTPDWIEFRTKQGREVTVDPSKMEKISVRYQTAYRYKFGNLATHPTETNKTSAAK